MNINFNLVVWPSLLAGLVTFFATPLVIRYADKLGIIDDPKKNKHPKVIHTYPVPRGGGLPIFIGLFSSALIFLPIDKHILGIILGAAILIVLGLLDDRYNLNPYKRLFVQIIAGG